MPTVPLRLVPLDDKITTSFGPDSRYLEVWLPHLGPVAACTWRHLAHLVTDTPTGVTVDAVECARAVGLGTGTARSSKLGRALERLTWKGHLGRWDQYQPLGQGQTPVYAVRAKLPPVPADRVRFLTPALRDLHETLMDEAAAAVAHPSGSVLCGRPGCTVWFVPTEGKLGYPNYHSGSCKAADAVRPNGSVPTYSIPG